MSNQIRAIEDLSTSWFGAPLGGHQAFGEIRCCLRLSGSPCAVLQLNPWAGRFIVREEYILQIAVQASFSHVLLCGVLYGTSSRATITMP